MSGCLAIADKQQNTAALISRLRDLEAKCLDVSTLDLPRSRNDVRKVYTDRLEQLEKSHSHSWFGDHATTYYQDFQPPPGGRSFDVEWGFVPGFSGSHNPGWVPYSREEIREYIFRDIGEDIFHELHELSERVLEEFSTIHDQTLGLMELLESDASSKAVERYTKKIEDDLKPYSPTDFINSRIKSTPRMTRDSEEIAKGRAVPVHVQYMATEQTIDINKRNLRSLAGVLRNGIETIELRKPTKLAAAASKKVFIGHGRSLQWRTLKDFITDRLKLEYEEFNRVSAAGIGTQERLSEMLSDCGFAFLILTAEDLHDDKTMHARENVIHEAGLFQGRLGWRKAIVLLEEGCEEFSNINGLGQIRFPKDKIESCFEDIRHVLEREGFLENE